MQSPHDNLHDRLLAIGFDTDSAVYKNVSKIAKLFEDQSPDEPPPQFQLRLTAQLLGSTAIPPEQFWNPSLRKQVVAWQDLRPGFYDIGAEVRVRTDAYQTHERFFSHNGLVGTVGAVRNGIPTIYYKGKSPDQTGTAHRPDKLQVNPSKTGR